MIWDVLVTSLQAAPVALLAGWLGKVWAERIARKEGNALAVKLELLRDKLLRQQELIAKTHEFSLAERAEITKRRLDAMNVLWEQWLLFRGIIGKFTIPYEMLTPSELGDPLQVSRLFPHSLQVVENAIDDKLRLMKEIDKLRPILPVAVYQHYKGLSIFYGRMAIKWLLYLEATKKKVCPWYLDSDGKLDFSVEALLSYGAAVKLNLPDPRAGNDSGASLTKWIELLENKFIQLLNEFVEGTLARHIEVHEAIRDLESKSKPE